MITTNDIIEALKDREQFKATYIDLTRWYDYFSPHTHTIIQDILDECDITYSEAVNIDIFFYNKSKGEHATYSKNWGENLRLYYFKNRPFMFVRNDKGSNRHIYSIFDYDVNSWAYAQVEFIQRRSYLEQSRSPVEEYYNKMIFNHADAEKFLEKNKSITLIPHTSKELIGK